MMAERRTLLKRSRSDKNLQPSVLSSHITQRSSSAAPATFPPKSRVPKPAAAGEDLKSVMKRQSSAPELASPVVRGEAVRRKPSMPRLRSFQQSLNAADGKEAQQGVGRSSTNLKKRAPPGSGSSLAAVRRALLAQKAIESVVSQNRPSDTLHKDEKSSPMGEKRKKKVKNNNKDLNVGSARHFRKRRGGGVQSSTQNPGERSADSREISSDKQNFEKNMSKSDVTSEIHAQVVGDKRAEVGGVCGSQSSQPTAITTVPVEKLTREREANKLTGISRNKKRLAEKSREKKAAGINLAAGSRRRIKSLRKAGTKSQEKRSSPQRKAKMNLLYGYKAIAPRPPNLLVAAPTPTPAPSAPRKSPCCTCTCAKHPEKQKNGGGSQIPGSASIFPQQVMPPAPTPMHPGMWPTLLAAMASPNVAIPIPTHIGAFMGFPAVFQGHLFLPQIVAIPISGLSSSAQLQPPHIQCSPSSGIFGSTMPSPMPSPNYFSTDLLMKAAQRQSESATGLNHSTKVISPAAPVGTDHNANLQQNQRHMSSESTLSPATEPLNLELDLQAGQPEMKLEAETPSPVEEQKKIKKKKIHSQEDKEDEKSVGDSQEPMENSILSGSEEGRDQQVPEVQKEMRVEEFKETRLVEKLKIDLKEVNKKRKAQARVDEEENVLPKKKKKARRSAEFGGRKGQKRRVKGAGKSIVSNWEPVGDGMKKTVYLSNDHRPLKRVCYESIKHKSELEVVSEKDCVCVLSGEEGISHIAKIYRLFTELNTGRLMANIIWYYRPDQIDCTPDPRWHFHKKELFASRHIDTIPVDCIAEVACVITFNEYCRFVAENRSETSIPSYRNELVSRGVESYPRRGYQPAEDTPEDVVYFVRRVYDFAGKKFVKNPQ